LPKAQHNLAESARYFQLDRHLETAINMALAVGAPLLLTGLPRNDSCGYIPNAGMSCPTRIRVFFWATGSVTPGSRRGAYAPQRAKATRHWCGAYNRTVGCFYFDPNDK
jgi:hypothetical protein